MDLDLTDEQKLIQDTTRDFARAKLEAVTANLGQEKAIITLLANLKKLAALGLMGINVKEEYGGSEAGAVAFNLAMTEIAKICPSTAVTVSANNMVCEIIQAIGSAEQKIKYIPKICSGAYLAGFYCLTEDCINSDPDNGGLNRKGINAFLVDADTLSLTIDKKEQKMGQQISVIKELILNNCRLPVSSMMGKLNDGVRIAVAELTDGCIGSGILELGIGPDSRLPVRV